MYLLKSLVSYFYTKDFAKEKTMKIIAPKF